MEHPDAKMHLRISIVKSVTRIVGALALCAPAYGADLFFALYFCGAALVIAEVLGIVEELV